jgi:hypothetical protein
MKFIIIGIIEMAPADKQSLKVIAKISPFTIAIVRIAVITTLIHDPSIELKNFIIAYGFA